jgi:choline kinase
MIVIILAAGKGSRLLNPDIPKPLTQLVNGKSILEMQLDAFSSIKPLTHICIVVGYKSESIINLYPDLTYVYNVSYAQENTSKSLMKALEGVDEDVLWANGDVVFHPSALNDLLQVKHSAMLVNAAEVAEEEVKYRSDKQGLILEVSKEVVQPEGEALGINLFKKDDLSILRESLKKCKDDDYFEKGVELCIQQGIPVEKVVIPYEHCVEIDFPEDIKRANTMIQSW